ncbi:MAG: plastocyanin/azurin family copper-binding protein [Steroidobacterales bacterium]
MNRHFRTSIAAWGMVALGCAAAFCPIGGWATDQPRVLIKDFMYMPMSLTVKPGTTVTWINMDDEPHNVISDAGLFRSGGFDTNESFSYRFDRPGTYHITCSIHPRMVATITVE